MGTFKKYRIIQKGSLFFLENQKTGAEPTSGLNNKSDLLNHIMQMNSDQVISPKDYARLIFEIVQLPIQNFDINKFLNSLPPEITNDEKSFLILEAEAKLSNRIIDILFEKPAITENPSPTSLWVCNCGLHGSIDINQDSYPIESKQSGIQTCIHLLSLKKITQREFDWYVESIAKLPKIPNELGINDQRQCNHS